MLDEGLPTDDVPDTEVPLLKGILTNLGGPLGANMPETEVELLRAISQHYGITVANLPDTEVPLLQQWAQSVGIPYDAANDMEVPLLTALLQQLGPHLFDFQQTEVPLLKQLLAATASPASPPVNITPPALQSVAIYAGMDVVCSQGTWTNSPTGYQYQWLLDGSPIGGEENDNYNVQFGDIGHDISCQVTAVNDSGSSIPAVSNSVTVSNGQVFSVSGSLYGATVPATSPPVLSLNMTGGSSGTPFNIYLDGITCSVVMYDSDPGGETIYIDTSTLTGPDQWAQALVSALSGQYTESPQFVFSSSGPLVTITNSELGTSAFLGADSLTSGCFLYTGGGYGTDASGFNNAGLFQSWQGGSTTLKFFDSYDNPAISALGVDLWNGTIYVFAYSNGGWVPVCSGPASSVTDGNYSLNDMGALSGWTLDQATFDAGIYGDDLYYWFFPATGFNTDFNGGTLSIGPFNILSS